MTLLRDSKVSYMTFIIGEPVGNPDAGSVWLWRDADGKFYVRDSAGVDVQIAGSIGEEFSAKGGILVGTGDGTYAEVAAGNDDEVLTADSGEAAGVKWAAASNPSMSREFTFMPEFPGGILHADGSANVGTMTWDDYSSMNAYVWTTSEGSTQDYDIVLRWRLPPEFSAIGAAVKVWSMVSDATGATGVRLVEFLDTALANVITAATKQNATWTEDSYTITGGTWTVGGIVTLRFRLFADAGDYARLGGVCVPWTAE